ncbi:MAG TPA: GPW/gp25 family protein [Flavitalea sp.]|nr:GPW/gp25 family protein [Flavitalea sp.]
MLQKKDATNDFLGRGWSFPPSFIKKGAMQSHVKMSIAVDDINESLRILLSTSLGERVMQPIYGCNLEDYQFEPMNSTLLGFIRDTVENALLYFEARIRVEEVKISESYSTDAINGYVRIEVQYQVRSSNSRFNFVYKFYLQERAKTELFPGDQR